MIRLSEKRKALFTGAASICFAVPALLSTTPGGINAARAEETAVVRNPNHLLQAAVERELTELGIESQASASGIELAAGESSPPVQPTGAGQPAGSFNNQHYQSEVQRQLQQLYRQDGRPMPNMVPTPEVPPEAWEQYQQRHGQLPTSGRRPGRWDWLKPDNWRRQWQRTFGRSNQSVPEPLDPPEFNPEGTEVLPQVPSSATATRPQPVNRPQDAAPQIRLQPTRTPQQAAVPAAPPAQSDSSQPRLFPGLLEEMQQPAPQRSSEPPTLILMPLGEDEELTEPVAAPPVEGFPFAGGNGGRPEPQIDSQLTRERLPALNSPLEEWAQDDESQSDTLLNPFPELAEEDADVRTGPYSGLQLEDDPFAEPLPAPADRPVAEDENPFAPFVERRAGASVSVQPELPPVDEVGPSLQGPGLPAEPGTLPSIQPRQLTPTTNADGSPTQSREVQEKMARIASRRGLTGMKGFCPVVLRDYRDLEDARAEFTVIYDGKQYWFSSDEAKQVFLLSPEVYAPVKGGIDLVHFQQTGEEQEGSLDFAAWFQGRLHLFSSSENKAAFVASPRTFSVDE